MGLDLWNKRGFLSWIIITLRKDPPHISKISIQAANPGILGSLAENAELPSDLVMALSNIIKEWSDKNVRQQNQERTSNS